MCRLLLVEGEVVVAPVPQDDVDFLLGHAQDLLVVDAGEDQHALRQVGFVLFPLLDGAVGGFQVVVAGEALRRLAHQIAVGHRVPNGGHLLPGVAQDFGHTAAGLALAAAGASGANRDDRLGGGNLRAARARAARKSAPAASTWEALCMT